MPANNPLGYGRRLGADVSAKKKRSTSSELMDRVKKSARKIKRPKGNLGDYL